jgi:hypothetical protein
MSGLSNSVEKKKFKQAHPLCGCNLSTLLTVVSQNGGVTWDRLPRLLQIGGSVLGRLPFTLLERAYFAARSKSFPEPRAPIFIVGHWRSGTTHLYNILSKSPDFGFTPPLATGLPWDMLIMARLFRAQLEKALPEERFIDRVPVKPDSPQEDEIPLASMQSVSFYHGLYFPKAFERNFSKGIFFDGCSSLEAQAWENRFRYFMRKLSALNGGRRLVIKNPVYTARVAHLKRIYPDAKFIHIYRNPYMVFQSMKNFYDKLIAELSLQTGVKLDVERIILDAYPRMMRQLEVDAADLEPNQYLELRYEDLERQPLQEIERVYEQLEIDGIDSAKPVFSRYLESVQHYQKNHYAITADSNQKVENEWSSFIQRWGYQKP